MAVDIREALRALNEQVGVPVDEIVQQVENALAVAYKREFETEGFVQARLDAETGDIALTATVTAEDGTQEVTELPVDEFRRLAAQTTRKVLLGSIRGLERRQVEEQMARRYGDLASGVIDRLDRNHVCYIDLGRAEGVLGPEEQVPGEELVVGRPITFVILDPRPSYGQARVKVSRAHRLFVQRTLESEIPEIAAGVVQVRALAREAGLRSKVAVSSNDPAVDPVGACLGPRSVRHHSLVADLNGEHVDIVTYSDDPERFVAAALGPAPVHSVSCDLETRTATVLVPAAQLSLAIGRDGQNARLAARLTNWRIDIHPVPEPGEDGAEPGAEPAAEEPAAEGASMEAPEGMEGVEGAP